MYIATVSKALAAKGFNVRAASDGSFTATKGDVLGSHIAYGYSEEEGVLLWDRVVDGDVDLVGSGMKRMLELIAEE